LGLAEYDAYYRYEQSGELFGLMRVRSLNVSVRLHHAGPQGAKPKAEVVADILASIKERRA